MKYLIDTRDDAGYLQGMKRKNRREYGESTNTIKKACEGLASINKGFTNKEIASECWETPATIAVVMHRKAKSWGLRKVSRGVWRRK